MSYPLRGYNGHEWLCLRQKGWPLKHTKGHERNSQEPAWRQVLATDHTDKHGLTLPLLSYYPAKNKRLSEHLKNATCIE